MEAFIKKPKDRTWHTQVIYLVIVAYIGILAGCDPGSAPASAPPAAGQPSDCSWTVWRYDNNNRVWASISSLLQLSQLADYVHRPLLCQGYVAADSTGQGCLYKPGCLQVWFWQNSGWTFGVDAIETCPRGSTSVSCSGSSTTTAKNCPIKIITKPANMTVKGTIATVVDAQDRQLTLVIVHEGAVDVEPAKQPGESLALETGQAAYYVSLEMTPEQQDQITREFDLPPNQPVPLDRIVPLVEWLQVTPQIQRANAVVLGEGEIVPLPIPFAWSLRSLEEQMSWQLANEFAVAWRTALTWEEWQAAPITYAAWLDEDRPFIRQLAGPAASIPDGADYDDFRRLSSNADILPLQEALSNAGYDANREVVLLIAEESIEELGPLADWIASQLNTSGLPTITQTVNSEALEGVISEWQTAGNPAFLLTWY